MWSVQARSSVDRNDLTPTPRRISWGRPSVLVNIAHCWELNVVAVCQDSSVALCRYRLPCIRFCTHQSWFCGPSVLCYVRTGFTLLDVFRMFLFSCFESSADLAYIAPGASRAIVLCTTYVTLVCFSGSGLSFGDGKRCSKARVVSLWFWCRIVSVSFYGIKITTKPLRTLEQRFPPPKDRPLPEKQSNVVYTISCADCSSSYIGETDVQQYKSGSNIAKHAWTQDHKINFDECKRQKIENSNDEKQPFRKR
jgi:hypothetical protein